MFEIYVTGIRGGIGFLLATRIKDVTWGRAVRVEVKNLSPESFKK